MNEPESNRAQLTQQIADGNVDLMLIATLLVDQVLPALDRIEERMRSRRFDSPLAAMVLAEIGTIYEYLQDMTPPKSKRVMLYQERMRWQERLENALKHLEAKQ
jgi:hypothetical protein